MMILISYVIRLCLILVSYLPSSDIIKKDPNLLFHKLESIDPSSQFILFHLFRNSLKDVKNNEAKRIDLYPSSANPSDIILQSLSSTGTHTPVYQVRYHYQSIPNVNENFFSLKYDNLFS